MGIPNYTKNFGDEWQKTQRKVKSNFTSGNRGTATTVIATDVLQITGQLTVASGGRFVGQYANGIEAFFVGPVTNDGVPGEGVVIRRADGTEVLHVEGLTSNESSWGLKDEAENTIVSDSGIGLGRPYLNVPFGNVISTMPGNTTGSLVTIHKSIFPKHHPQFRMHLQYNITSTTGDININLTTVADGTVSMYSSLGLSGTGSLDFGFDMLGEFLEPVTMEVQTRVASGAGSAGVVIVGAYGVETGGL
jgi:hypothetical protein